MKNIKIYEAKIAELRVVNQDIAKVAKTLLLHGCDIVEEDTKNGSKLELSFGNISLTIRRNVEDNIVQFLHYGECLPSIDIWIDGKRALYSSAMDMELQRLVGRMIEDYRDEQRANDSESSWDKLQEFIK